MYDAFLSYASEDVNLVTKLNTSLRERGLKTWFDKNNLHAGKWYPQIEKAICNARSMIVCLSDAAIEKLENGRGVQDNEISSAYYLAQSLPPAQFTILPVRLEDCARGDHRLAIHHQFDLFHDWDASVDRIAIALGGVPIEESWQHRATALFLKKDFIGSYGHWTASLALGAPVTLAKYWLGLCCLNLGKPIEALEHLNQALENKQDHLEIHLALALTYKRLNELEKSNLHIQQILERDPKNEEALALRTWNLVNAPLTQLTANLIGNVSFSKDVADKLLIEHEEFAYKSAPGYDVVDFRCNHCAEFVASEGRVPDEGVSFEAGEPLAWIISMLQSWPICSPHSGIIERRLVQDGEKVEFGQPLVEVRCF